MKPVMVDGGGKKMRGELRLLCVLVQ